MKLLQIKYFYTVCRCGSITKAAEKLFVSQPTISFCIKELEDEFGLKLFQRKHGRMVLTVEGQFFLEKPNIFCRLRTYWKSKCATWLPTAVTSKLPFPQ